MTPIETPECFVATCDGCQAEFEQDDRTCHFGFPEDLRDALRQHDWVLNADGSIACNVCREDTPAETR